MTRVQNIFPVVPTLMHEDESIDFEATVDLTKHALEKFEGVTVLGTSSENLYFTYGERLRMIAWLADEIDPSRCILGISEPATRNAVDLAKFGKSFGFQRFLVMMPTYFPASRETIVNHYRRVTEEAGAKVFYYHYPSISRIQFDEEMMREIFALPGIIGTKVSGSGVEEHVRIRAAAGGKNEFIMLTGSSFLIPEICAKTRLDGSICNLPLVARIDYGRMLSLAKSGNIAAAQEERNKGIDDYLFVTGAELSRDEVAKTLAGGAMPNVSAPDYFSRLKLLLTTRVGGPKTKCVRHPMREVRVKS
ncbi:MAG: dihydrodipicolinate synthase family protein [Planctomycetes bacterium]|nr:dihydrodipicolinate synthase family protein [Planctomycetota bacterium]